MIMVVTCLTERIQNSVVHLHEMGQFTETFSYVMFVFLDCKSIIYPSRLTNLSYFVIRVKFYFISVYFVK